MQKKFKIGIIGIGVVGRVVKNWFQDKKYSLFLYDKYKNIGSIEEVNKAGIIFICVPTPFTNKKGFDLSYVQDAISYIGGKKIIVIKSTVWPGTTETLQKKYPQHKFLFNPEFLTESTADYDFRHPDREIMGYTHKSRKIARKILDILPKSSFTRMIPASEAEMVKYFNNTFNAVKVIFGNQIYDLCQAININYDRVMECAAASKFIRTQDHLHVIHKGYRGYGGKCLPKDIRSLIQFANLKGIDLKLLKTTEKINNQLTKGRRIKDKKNYV